MDKKIEETREFLQTIGMPKAQQADICCYVILAMAGVKPDMSWSEATNEWIRIHDIIQFVNAFYGMSYAENSRETFRKQALHRFRTAALIEDNGTATNSPNYRYRLTEETVQILRTMGTPKWGESIKRFLCYHEKLIDLYASKKKMTMMPVNINGESFKFSAGKHNELQKAIIEEFAPRFAPNSEFVFLRYLRLPSVCSFLALRLSPVTIGTTAAWMCGVFSSMCRWAATTLSLPNVACSHWMLSLHHSSSFPFSCMFIMSSCVPDKTTRTTRTWSCVIFRLMPAVFSLWAIASSLP